MPAASREENGLNGEKFICKTQVRNFPCTVLFSQLWVWTSECGHQPAWTAPCREHDKDVKSTADPRGVTSPICHSDLSGWAPAPHSCPHPRCCVLRAVGNSMQRAKRCERAGLAGHFPRSGCKAWGLDGSQGGGQLGWAE